MNRFRPLSGILAVAMGVAWLLPATAAWLSDEALEPRKYAVASAGPILIMIGLLCILSGFHALRLGSIPAPVRASIAGNALFLAFCALEFSDGLIRQSGRVFYWTSVLFLPALMLFFGQVSAQRWAWWMTRAVAGLLTVWFLGFLVAVPFVHLRGNGGAIPWWGRIYVAGVTLIFASTSGYVFRSLGRDEARGFYGREKEG